MAARARRRAAQDTRRALMEAAGALFAERGFAGATLDLIAERSGANKAMVAYYFKDKAGLYQAVLEEAVDSVLEVLARRVSDDAPPEARLEAHIGAMAEAFAGRSHLPRMLLQEYLAGGGAQRDEKAALKLSALFRRTEAVLADGAAAGAFRPVDAHMTHLSLIGALAFFDVTAPMRSALEQKAAWTIPSPDRAAYVAHLRALFAAGVASDRRRGRI